MNTADILHDTAMEYYDLGKIAKIKGEEDVYTDYLQKAYLLNKEAALQKQLDAEDTFWKYVYLRSAAWLAIDCEKWIEAQTLATIGLQGTPPPTEKVQLEAILEKVTANLPAKTQVALAPNAQPFLGILTSVDSVNACIVINGGTANALKMKVATDQVDELVKLFWGKIVEGIGIVLENGELGLQQIQRAA